jgi:hypothetical protein
VIDDPREFQATLAKWIGAVNGATKRKVARTIASPKKNSARKNGLKRGANRRGTFQCQYCQKEFKKEGYRNRHEAGCPQGDIGGYKLSEPKTE